LQLVSSIDTEKQRATIDKENAYKEDLLKKDLKVVSGKERRLNQKDEEKKIKASEKA
jgi:hypothetical protein